MTSDYDAALHQEEERVEEGRSTKLEDLQVETFSPISDKEKIQRKNSPWRNRAGMAMLSG